MFELAVKEDHVHLYAGVQPKYSPSDIIRLIRGGTSNKIRQMFPELDEVYWGSTFWADGYLVKTVGEIDDKVVSEYTKKQR